MIDTITNKNETSSSSSPDDTTTMLVLASLEILPDDFFFSAQAAIYCTTSGTISAICSILVMSIIWRSQSRFSTAYHRIMFCMSFGDMITSIAMAVTTLPMPTDVIFPFAFPSIGNEYTCATQGFLIVIGTMFTIGANCTLNLYYACVFWFGMRQDTIKKRILPPILIFFVMAFVPSAIIPLAVGLFNPKPWEPYCFIGSYPPHCNVDTGKFADIECIGSDIPLATEDAITFLYVGMMGFCFCLIFVSLLMVVISIFMTEMTMRQILRDHPSNRYVNENDNNNNNHNNHNNNGMNNGIHNFTHEDSFRETRTVLRVALMYIAAFFLSWMWPLISVLLGNLIGGWIWFYVDRGKLICGPLQGFFNAFIFIYQKQHTMRERDRSLTFWQAVKRVITSPGDVPEVIVSRVDLVQDDNDFRDFMDQQAAVRVMTGADNGNGDDDDGVLSTLSGDDNNNDDEEKSQEIGGQPPSEISPVDTPPFALSNVSSSGVSQSRQTKDRVGSKGGEEDADVDISKGEGDGECEVGNDDSRQYYSDTPSELLTWKGNTMASFLGTATVDANDANVSGARSNKSGRSRRSGGRHRRGGRSRASGSASASGSCSGGDLSEGSGSSPNASSGIHSVGGFTLNSLLSGFSSALTPVEENEDSGTYTRSADHDHHHGGPKNDDDFKDDDLSLAAP